MADQNPAPEDQNDLSTSPSDVVPDDPQDQTGKRSAEARINELLSKNKELIDEVKGLREKVETIPIPTPPVVPPQPDNPEVKKAIDYLKQTGKFVDENDLEARLTKEVRNITDRLALDSEHQRLERMFDGSDGRPKYDRQKAEEYMRKFGGMPDAAYKIINEPELLDWNIKQAEADRKKKPYIAKPNSTAGIREDNTISRDRVQNVINNPTPKNRAWYEQHREEILKLFGEGKL